MSHLSGEEIVISGISGVFPNAKNVQQFGENLFNKVDMVNKDDRFAHIRNPEFSKYLGRIKEMESFDSHFFRVTPKQAACIDPSMGKLMEHTFTALFDAGINPETLKGSKIGVYVAAMYMDTVNTLYDETKVNAYRLTGGSKTMFANRISYWIDGKGPSYACDYGCAGSMAALEMAYNGMKSGSIDCAIVGGSNYIFMPELTHNMKRAGLVCLDGKTKCFDKHGDGFVRSDAVNVYFLQKAKDAKRIYSEVYHVKGKYFASPDGLFTAKRNPKDIEKFLDEFYSEIDVSPSDVEYVEANSFGIAEADGNELEAIGNVFAKNKNIQVGSVKSNMGNSEGASGACSITKMCLAYQKGHIPANLHFNEPLNHINAVKEGKIQVVTENSPFSKNYTAINNFCYTGGNFHALLKGHYKPKDTQQYKSSIPRLVLVSSRKEDAVNKMLDILETNPIDPELCALLNNFYKHTLPSYTGRGYTLLDSNENDETVCLSRGFEFYSGKTRPIWFLFSGMGSQWAGMGEGLLRIPVFASAIEKCHKLLLPEGVDVIKIITDKKYDFNIMTSMVAITAVQIGLCDVLTSLGIVPDNIIGHSMGEIGCAYADGSLTAEETLLASYYRGLVSYQTEFIHGAMAAVGLGHQEVAQLCPQEIEIACHNSSESTTISGPADAVTKFVKNLTDQGVFAKEVNSYDIAFHSRYIAEAGPKMLKILKKLITRPKPRSTKWIATCYLPEDWHKPESQYVSAEYLTHNLLRPVLFEEAAKLIPEDALIIEIAPHGLLQAIMKRSHSECVNLSLTRKGETDSTKFLLKAVGSLYQIGLNLDLEALYPKVKYPVSTETSTLTHFVGWNYSTDWNDGASDQKVTSDFKEFIISYYDDEFAYIRDYVQNGVNVLPETAIFVFVWQTLAESKKKCYTDMSIKFENIVIHKQVIISPEEILRLKVTLHKGSNTFEVTHKETVIVDGTIRHLNKTNNRHDILNINENHETLTQNDIYTFFKNKGYLFGEDFQLIMSSNIERNIASVKWDEHWLPFLDSIIQLNALSKDHEGVSCLKFIRNFTINTAEHKLRMITKNGVHHFNALILENTGITKCGGVIIEDLIFTDVPKPEIVPDIQKILKINVLGKDNSRHHTHVSNGVKNDTQRVELVAKEPSNIDSLTWTDAPVISQKETIQVCYSGLSTKDCKKLSDLNKQAFGMDFSGLDTNGNKVMGVLSQGALATTVEADYDLLWPVPKHWSMAEAATVPLPFVHAFYCLAVRCPVPKNSNILVIGAAGALGQAVICIALSLGCTIYGTVANADKKKFLLKLFPELDENNIGYTYNDSFRAMVIERTRNERCKIVISSSSGYIREAAMGCVGFMGDFLDVNDSDQKENKNISMYYLTLSKSYESVNMSTIFAQKYSKHKKVLQGLISEGIAKGIVRPLTYVIFSPLDASRAFKLLSTRNNRGRVLINMKELTMPKQDVVQIPRMSLYSFKSYIVLWDGSELGVQLIDLLIRRGATRLLIHCKPKSMNGYFHVKQAGWIKDGVLVELDSDDLQTEEKCHSLIAKTENKLGLLDGVFITWNVYAKTNDKEKEVISMIVSNLDIASRKCVNLRYFGVVSAIVQEVVNVNILKDIEKCCSRRNELGLPSLSLSHVVGDKILHLSGMTELLNLLESSLKQKYVNVRTSHTEGKNIEKSEKNAIKGNTKTNFGAGMKAFFRYISEDEIQSTEPIIQMKTKLGSSLEPELTIDPEDTYILMVPGFEGNSEYFSTLSELLNKPAIVLQLDPNYNESISQIAKNLLKHLKTRIVIKSPFHIMGYSFGVNVALEIAALLEKEGLLGVVYCLDTSPDALPIQLDAYLGILTEEQLQNCLIEHFYALLVGDKSAELMENVKNTTKWSEKVEIIINNAKYHVHHSHEYMKSLLNAAYDRINMAKQYKPNFKLDSEIVLLRGNPHPKAKQLSEDYNLSMYTYKPVTVFDIESDHAMAVYDCKVSNYINRFFFL